MPDEPEGLKKNLDPDAAPVTKTAADPIGAQGLPSKLPDEDKPLEK